MQQAGEENNYIFGYRVEELNARRDSYEPKTVYEYEPRVRRVVDTLIDGTFSDDNTGAFADLHRSLLLRKLAPAGQLFCAARAAAVYRAQAAGDL